MRSLALLSLILLGACAENPAPLPPAAQALLSAETPEATFAGKAAHKLDADCVKQIVDAMDRAREAAAIPGVGLALVQDGKVVFEGGLGVRELGKPAKIDAHTRFMIASNTKALTTLLLAKLVDEGKLTWETPVTTLFPGFKLGDPDTTREVRVKHLICACTGLPRQDFEWLFGFARQTPRSVLDTLGTMQPTTKFGEFGFGGWKSAMATRKNDDGTTSMVTISPGANGIGFVVGTRDGKRVLVVRDMQHEYVFTEAG